MPSTMSMACATQVLQRTTNHLLSKNMQMKIPCRLAGDFCVYDKSLFLLSYVLLRGAVVVANDIGATLGGRSL